LDGEKRNILITVALLKPVTWYIVRQLINKSDCGEHMQLAKSAGKQLPDSRKTCMTSEEKHVTG